MSRITFQYVPPPLVADCVGQLPVPVCLVHYYVSGVYSCEVIDNVALRTLDSSECTPGRQAPANCDQQSRRQSGWLVHYRLARAYSVSLTKLCAFNNDALDRRRCITRGRTSPSFVNHANTPTTSRDVPR